MEGLSIEQPGPSTVEPTPAVSSESNTPEDVDYEVLLHRLRERKRIRELIGGKFFGDEEDEYLRLESDFHTAFINNLRNYANTVPAPIEFETPVEVFTESDVLKWRGGAQRFRDFSEVIRDRSMREKFEAIFNPVHLNALKALFLGEKPVVLLGNQGIPLDTDSSAILDLLRSFGVENVGRYIYDREQVKDVIEKNKNVFEAFGSDDPDEVMNIIGRDRSAVSDHLAVGILLGFPVESVERFAKEEKDGNKLSKRKDAEVYGISWMDFDDTLESKIKQARLKAAFELSGILSL